MPFSLTLLPHSFFLDASTPYTTARRDRVWSPCIYVLSIYLFSPSPPPLSVSVSLSLSSHHIYSAILFQVRFSFPWVKKSFAKVQI